MKKKLLAILLVAALCLTATAVLASCAPKYEGDGSTLVVGYSPFSSKFSTFFAKTAYDQDVAGMTGIALLTNDRGGNIILKGIDGETVDYNGTPYTYYGPANFNIVQNADTTVYEIEIRDDLRFSDGKKVTIDDVIFSMYVLCDPNYTGSSTLYSVPIQGVTDFRIGVKSDIAEKYAALADQILAAGAANTDFSKWTEDQQKLYFGDALNDAGVVFAQEIVDYVTDNYIAYADAGYAGDFTATDVLKTEGVQIAFGMAMWGFGGFEGKTFTDANGDTYNMTDKFPTTVDYWNNINAAYGGDINAMERETAGSSLAELTKTNFIRVEGPKDPESGGEIKSIAGIQKTGKYTMTVTTDGFSAKAIYQLGITIAPLHYYGDASKFNINRETYGFDKGDLSTVEAKTTHPMGAGAYIFDKFVDGLVYFEANPYYYKGAPKIQYLRFRETTDALKISGVITGTMDVSDPSISENSVKAIQDANSNGELSGNVIETSLVDNLGYGYIGINSENVNVGGDKDSEASINYRKGLATLLAVYRDVVINTYYGERAVVIQYPISNTSWAAPMPADEGYEIAFSKDVDGNSIYTADMETEAKYAAAREAAIGFFKAAGFTFDEATGKFTAAPEGAALTLGMDIPADGIGDHPSFAIFTYVEEVLDSLGFDVTITDYASSTPFWDKLEANNMQIWAAAWGATIDPDMYQVYHSSNNIGDGGTDSNHYNIADDELDDLILEALTSSDRSFRKGLYKECLDIIADWAVEIPTYQRKNCIIFSAERINLETITPDITTFWGWGAEIEKLEMVKAN